MDKLEDEGRRNNACGPMAKTHPNQAIDVPVLSGVSAATPLVAVECQHNCRGDVAHSTGASYHWRTWHHATMTVALLL